MIHLYDFLVSEVPKLNPLKSDSFYVSVMMFYLFDEKLIIGNL